MKKDAKDKELLAQSNIDENEFLNKVRKSERGTGELVQTKGASQTEQERGGSRGSVRNEEQKVCVTNSAQIIRNHICQSRKVEEITRAFLTYEFKIESNSFVDDYEDQIYHALLAHNNNDPAFCGEALQTDERMEWQHATDEEVDSLIANDVFESVDEPFVSKDGTVFNELDAR
ncbi:hypothetical protein QAD02_021664 [Eretmocerus hayati]|uniref:Uncharacterized protein n=1 Tax=Eretmocerus hayati TaxID=131215 RepID=A0ACC2PSR3_9HYME|nr:hypothetical protein QAD02_021664 [Eretmocerus hayati]